MDLAKLINPAMRNRRETHLRKTMDMAPFDCPSQGKRVKRRWTVKKIVADWPPLTGERWEVGTPAIPLSVVSYSEFQLYFLFTFKCLNIKLVDMFGVLAQE